MLRDYLIVHKSILPDYYEKVLEVRKIMESGKVREVSQAVKMVGISRSTYYKYKDYIMEPSDLTAGRKAVLSMMLTHETGVLSALLQTISSMGASVLTITQSLPVHGRASVTVSLDISNLSQDIEVLMKELAGRTGVENLRLVALE